MSIFLPDAQQFVIIGTRLKDELENHDLFNNYFSDKKHKLKFIENLENFNINDYSDLSRTLFIIKHFDFNPDSADTKHHTNGFNNNHIVNPQFARLNEEESEVDSVGYTTDYDDIEEDQMEVTQEDQEKQHDEQKNAIESPYDGGSCFKTLVSYKCCIMGSIALIQTLRQLKSNDELVKMVNSERPLHNLAMQNFLITFSGIASKFEAQQLLTLTRYMGAKSREDVTNKTTHLVAGNPRGAKYRKALEFDKFIMSSAWVRESFRLAQNDPDFHANCPKVVQAYRLKPFHGLHMAFVGFRDDEVKELFELTSSNDGIVVDVNNLSCSHIIVDAIKGFDDSSSHILKCINQSTIAHVVYREWFWASLEMEGKVIEDDYAVPGFKPQTRRASRISRASTGGLNSFKDVLSPNLDYSRSPDSISFIADRQVQKTQSVSDIAKKELDYNKITARHRACLELLQTERNYVKVLETIVNLFKVPLENPENTDPILPATEVKIVFGNLTPIYEVHKKMLGNLIGLIETDWNETNLIGKVFVTHSIELFKAYPPFVNFFEDTKKTLNTCDTKYPRFHAFLKRCQSRIECNRESLTEMLIRPVQRLPSISLIITELLKRTDDSNPDKEFLREALESIRRVMNLINEDKRKTEGQIAMFDIVNNIEDCPPNLLSALRKFVCKAEARLLFTNSESEIIPSKSHKVVLFLFSDLIEICKIRSLKRSHSSRGSKTYVPIRRGLNGAQASRLSNKKEHRHLDELRLYDVMNLYKECESSEMSDAFVIQARPSSKYDQNFRYYPVILDDESMTKATFIEKLEQSLLNCDDAELVSEYVPNDMPPIKNKEIDFGYANQLVSSMEKSRLSRVLSIRQALLSPSLKSQRNLYNHFHASIN